jgi:hypothetical protein
MSYIVVYGLVLAVGVVPMPQGLYFACRVLFTKPDKLEFIVVQESEIGRRHDVEVASEGFETETEAELAIQNIGGVIPSAFPLFLDNFEGDDLRTVWCWKDDRTVGSSQIFESEEEALEAMNAELLEFETVLD